FLPNRPLILRPFVFSTLELQAQRELNQARTAERTSGCPDCRGRGGANGLDDLTEAGVAAVGHRVGEICVVEDIEEVGFECQPRVLSIKRKVLRYLEVPPLHAA